MIGQVVGVALRSAVLAVLAIGLSLGGTPIAVAQEFYGFAAVNDDKQEIISLKGSSRSVSISASQGEVYVPGFVAGLTYTLEARGTFSWGSGTGQRADAECMTDVAGDGLTGARWGSKRWIGWMGTDFIDLKTDSMELEWTPVDPYQNLALGDPNCSSTHTYRTAFVPTFDMVRFLINDPHGWNNSGSMELNITRQPFSGVRGYQCPKWVEEPLAPQGVVGEIEAADVMMDTRTEFGLPLPSYQEMDYTKDPSSPYYPHRWSPYQNSGHRGIYTCNYAMPDVQYKITVMGSYTQNESVTNELGPQYAMADAECATGMTAGDTTWKRNRFDFTNPSFSEKQDALDLRIDYHDIDWRPVVDNNGDGCADDPQHTYTTIWVPKWHGPIHFGIYDFAYAEGDNRGELCMDIQKLG